eukprot:CAMPEP_0174335128 /NCGR_PEP_ID=MMETSP0810-20121108/20523_1 /TAXON_ID=73025 ORGANISM="Eutreptiella gymnastica-like, Strain CCMP1594" /NCGR_SAMPLE_ID=MMETSP0810 /ASSEMBLY_ACC=CAM_ASM_000659 /LENGTH=38 /DNA_ID= /DNA_START= /DNA_END= /DNA_ORIENTATION=
MGDETSFGADGLSLKENAKQQRDHLHRSEDKQGRADQK